MTGSLLTMGVHHLPPREEIALHRHANRDHVLFVHKGQGRVTVEGHVVTVVPGISIAIPRQTWYEVRNTGTGILQLVWVATPPGVEDSYRELSRLSSPVDPAALQLFAGRHGIEFPAAGASIAAGVQAPLPAQRRRRRHRGGRGRGRRGPGSAQQPVVAQQPQLAAPPAVQAPSSPPVRRHRRRRRGGTSPRVATPSAVTPASAWGPPGKSGAPLRRPSTSLGTTARLVGGDIPSESPPGKSGARVEGSKATAPAATETRRRPQSHHRRRVKEVYMGGRWVQVTGEGPVIDSGHERSASNRKSPGTDDPPARPLSVTL